MGWWKEEILTIVKKNIGSSDESEFCNLPWIKEALVLIINFLWHLPIVDS